MCAGFMFSETNSQQAPRRWFVRWWGLALDDCRPLAGQLHTRRRRRNGRSLYGTETAERLGVNLRVWAAHFRTTLLTPDLGMGVEKVAQKLDRKENEYQSWSMKCPYHTWLSDQHGQTGQTNSPHLTRAFSIKYWHCSPSWDKVAWWGQPNWRRRWLHLFSERISLTGAQTSWCGFRYQELSCW